jgi:hypothetical protein
MENNGTELRSDRMPIGLGECAALIMADHSANLLNGVSAVTYGGSGIDEVEMLPAPISAVQLVLASIGAPGSR